MLERIRIVRMKVDEMPKKVVTCMTREDEILKRKERQEGKRYE